jgi:amino acid permease
VCGAALPPCRHTAGLFAREDGTFPLLPQTTGQMAAAVVPTRMSLQSAASKQSSWGIILNLVKCSMGAGSFALPWAVAKFGWGLSILGFVAFWVLTVITILQLAWVEERVFDSLPATEKQRREAMGSRLSYPELARIALPWATVELPCRRHGAAAAASSGMYSSETAIVPGATPASGPGEAHPKEIIDETTPMASRMHGSSAAAASATVVTDTDEPDDEQVHPPAFSSTTAVIHSSPSLVFEARKSMSAQRDKWDCNVMSVIAFLGIVTTAVGVGAVYVDFVSSVIPAAVPQLSPIATAAIMFPVVLLLTILGRLDWLAYTSFLGNIAIAAGIIAVLSVPVPNAPEVQEVPPARVVGAGQFIGSTSFLFAIHIIALPVIEGVALAKRNLAVHASFAIISLGNALFSLFAALRFGAGVSSNVIEDVGDGPFQFAIRLLLVVDLVATMPVVLLAAVKVMERALRVSTWRSTHQHILVLTVRSLTVFASFLLAFLVPNFGQLVSLVGGIASCLMGFVLPPLLFASIKHSQRELTVGVSVYSGVIFVCGLIAMILTLLVQVSP